MAAFKKKTEIAILGGGITGLILAAYLEKEGRDYLLIESEDFGGLARGQSLEGAQLDFGLKSVPLSGPLTENPLAQIKEDLNLKFQIESFGQSARFFANKTFSEFVGFGDNKNKNLVQELSYYAQSPRLLVAGGWKNLIDELIGLIPEEKKLSSCYVTRFSFEEENLHSVVINGESVVQAEKFVFTLSPALLKEFLAGANVSGKVLQRIARTEPFTAINMDLALTQPITGEKGIFILSESGKSEDEFFVLGQFTNNVDPIRENGGVFLTTWMTLVDEETLGNDENGSKVIKQMKKLISKAFPSLLDSVKWERLLVIPEALGSFSQLTLEKNGTLPGIGNLWICGGKVQSAHRNILAALDSARKVASHMLTDQKISRETEAKSNSFDIEA